MTELPHASSVGAHAAGWSVVLPVKGGTAAKSRLLVPGVDRGRLATAMALDCVAAVTACPVVDDVLVVTPDPEVSRWVVELGARAVPESQPGAGLRRAVRDGLEALADLRAGVSPVAVLLGDLPALSELELRQALDRARAELGRHGSPVFVPDAEGTGTVLLAARGPGSMVPAFGPSSALAHEAAGYRRLDLALPRLRRDVDTAAALEAAVALGVGPRTRATVAGTRPPSPAQRRGHRRLPSMQATVLTYDPATGGGSVVLDDGAALPMRPGALDGSGLRHLRPGQRLTIGTVEEDGDVVVDSVRIVGI